MNKLIDELLIGTMKSTISLNKSVFNLFIGQYTVLTFICLYCLCELSNAFFVLFVSILNIMQIYGVNMINSFHLLIAHFRLFMSQICIKITSLFSFANLFATSIVIVIISNSFEFFFRMYLLIYVIHGLYMRSKSLLTKQKK